MGVNTKRFDSASDMITFSRASGAYGLTKVGYGSELISNGDFSSDSDWTKIGTATISGGQANLATTNDEIQQGLAVAGVTYEVRINWTVGTGTYLKIYIGGTYKQVFTSDLTFLITATSAQAFRFIAGNGSATISEISVKEVFYNSSDPSATLKLIYHPNDVPRIEYNVDGSAKGLLIEEARTNFVSYSENLVAWVKGGVSAILDYTILPPYGMGNFVSKVILNNTAFSSKYINAPTASNPGGSTTCFSVWLKYGTQQFVDIYGQYTLWMDGGSGCRVDLLNKTVTDLSGSTQSTITLHPNDWVHVQVISNFNNVIGSGRPFYLWAVDSAGASAAGATSNTNTYFYAWGAQTEIGSFPTSYIKTENATATRAVDLASIPVSKFGYNTGAGTFVATASLSYNPSEDERYVIGTDSSSRRWIYKNDSLDELRVFDGATSITSAVELEAGQLFKVGVFTDSSTKGIVTNGETPVTNATDSNLTSLTSSLKIGNSSLSYNALNGHIKSIQYYPRRLTDAQLQELTT